VRKDPIIMPKARLLVVLLVCLSVASASSVAAFEVATAREQARELDNPIAYTKGSVAQGRRHYLRLCQTCHGADGRALENIDFEASDLTSPDYWASGDTDGDLFHSTKEGAGTEMPAFRDKLSDVQIWEIVNFIRSIGPEDRRPPLVEEP